MDVVNASVHAKLPLSVHMCLDQSLCKARISLQAHELLLDLATCAMPSAALCKCLHDAAQVLCVRMILIEDIPYCSHLVPLYKFGMLFG